MDAGDCLTEASFTIDGPEAMTVTTTESVAGCFPEQTGQLEVAVQGGTGPYTYNLIGSGEQSSPIFTDLTEEAYRLEVRDALDCRTDVLPISLEYPAPVTLDLGEDLVVDLGETVTLQAETTGALAGEGVINWNFTAGHVTPDADFFDLIATTEPESSGTVSASLRMPDGCMYSDDISVRVVNTVNLFIPTAFSPNGDGVNDVFAVYSNVGVTRIENFQVFDRWGGQVFVSEARDVEWDGTRGGEPLDPGSYIYTGMVRLRSGQTQPIRGTVLLMR